jgi:hypothetical protein
MAKSAAQRQKEYRLRDGHALRVRMDVEFSFINAMIDEGLLSAEDSADHDKVVDALKRLHRGLTVTLLRTAAGICVPVVRSNQEQD